MSSLLQSLALKRINPPTTSTTAIHSVPRISAINSPAIYHKSYCTVQMAESEPATNPDAKIPVPEELEGDTNPATGEVGDPKRGPVRFGDMSIKGRVTNF
ncbi:putative mitochondrial protein, conserved [Entomortierella beljakovae]|nr:putative mitochondrial protein, conserved [Entomortierella beljakovae]